MSAGVARLVVVGLDARVYTPYAYRELIKSFPGRTWDPDGRCWAPVYLVEELADSLRLAGLTVFVTRPDGSAWSSGRENYGHRSTPSPTWAEALFAAVGPERAEAVFRALVRVLHPDVGGSDQLMQQLNAAPPTASGSSR